MFFPYSCACITFCFLHKCLSLQNLSFAVFFFFSVFDQTVALVAVATKAVILLVYL